MFENKGTFGVEWVTENGHHKFTKFNNGDVSMPIMSIRLWAQDGHRNIFDADDGEMIHLPTGESDPYHGRLGSYFVTMCVPDSVIEEADSPFVRPMDH